MAGSIVQFVEASAAVAGTSLGVSITCTAGNFLHVSAISDDATATCADTGSGNTPGAEKGSVIEAGIPRRLHHFVYPITTGGTNTVTVTFGASVANRQVIVTEVAGVSAYDAQGVQTDAGGSANTTAATATNSAQPAFGVAVCMDYQGGTPTVNAGYTSGGVITGGGLLAGRIAYRSFSTVALQSVNFGIATNRSCTVFALLLEGSPPTFSAQPTAQEAEHGATATFSAIVADATSYQWQDNSTGSFANISGATSSSYTTGATTQRFQGRQYRLIATNANGSTNSQTVRLAVFGFPIYLWSTALQSGNDVWLRDPLSFDASGATAGVAQAASQAAGGLTVIAAAAAQAAAQAGAALTVVARGEAQSASQAAGAVAADSVVTAVGSAQAASQAAGVVVESVSGAAQAAGQAAALVVEVVAGSGQAASQAAARAAVTASGSAQAAGQATGAVVETVAATAQAASQAAAKAVAVAQGESQSAGQAAGSGSTGSTISAVGVAQAASQATAAAAVTAAATSSATGQAAASATLVGSGAAQSAGQAAAAGVAVVRGEAQSSSQAGGIVTSGSTLVATGVSQSAGQAAGAVSISIKAEAQAASQASAAAVDVARGESSSASQARAAAAVTAAGSAQSVGQAGGAVPVEPSIVVMAGVSMSASQAAGQIGGLAQDAGSGGPDEQHEQDKHFAKRTAAGKKLYAKTVQKPDEPEAPVEVQAPTPAPKPRQAAAGVPGGAAGLSDLVSEQAIQEVAREDEEAALLHMILMAEAEDREAEQTDAEERAMLLLLLDA